MPYLSFVVNEIPVGTPSLILSASPLVGTEVQIFRLVTSRRPGARIIRFSTPQFRKVYFAASRRIVKAIIPPPPPPPPCSLQTTETRREA